MTHHNRPVTVQHHACGFLVLLSECWFRFTKVEQEKNNGNFHNTAVFSSTHDAHPPEMVQHEFTT